MTLKKVSVVGAALLLITVGFLAGRFAQPAFKVSAGGLTGSPTVDFNDPRQVVGLGHNVFTAYVVRYQGTTTGQERGPETQFLVRVLKTLKGNLKGIVTVNQRGGYDRVSNELILFQGEPLLSPGSNYLFITANRDRPDGQRWHTALTSGAHRLTNEEHGRQVEAQYAKAVNEEIRTWNSPKN